MEKSVRAVAYAPQSGRLPVRVSPMILFSTESCCATIPLMARGDRPPTIIPPMVTRLIIKTEIPFSTATNSSIGMMTATISPPAPAAEMIAPKRKKITGRIFAFPLARHTMFLESACVVPFKVAIPKRNVVARTIKNTLVGQCPGTS